MKTNKRISKRGYPPRECKFSGEIFIPTDVRQIFSVPQNRINYHNDLRVVNGAPLKSISDMIANNDKILKKAFESLKRLQQEAISIDILLYEGYHFEICSSVSVNKKTGNKIQWNISYGIEGFDQIKNTFIIHKK